MTETEQPRVAEHVYKTVGDTPLTLRMFRQAGWRSDERRSAIVLFFGGGWTNGTPSQFEPQCRHLAARGMVAFAADYRVRSRHSTSPLEAMADARSAIRWVRAHSRELGVDPDRIAAGGGSAGGHLAVCAALIRASDEPGEDKAVRAEPDALVLFNPVLDTTAIPLAGGLLGSRVRDASPLHHVAPGAPPVIIFHGTADTAVPFSQAMTFCERMRELGNRCELVPFEGQEHGFFNFGRGDGWAYRETLAETERFLASIGLCAPGVGTRTD